MNELEIIRHRQMEGLSLFLNTVDYRTPHLHSEWELIWVLEQPLAVTCGQKQYLAEPGQLILLNPNEPHEFRKQEESCTFLCLQVSPWVLPIPERLYVDSCFPGEFLTEEERRELKRQLRNLMQVYLQRGEQHALYCLGIGCLIFYTLFSRMPVRVLTAEQAASQDKRNARLKRLIRYVEENYDHKIRLSDFAEAEGCSMSYLSHFVKEAMNQTFQDYVTSVRMGCACRLMADGGKRMLDVCMESGFSDYRYFSKAFRQQYGMTPEEYSRNAQTKKAEGTPRPSIHSQERFYSREESLRLLKALTG